MAKRPILAITVLALTLSDPADYDKVQEDDKVSIVGLKDLAPGALKLE